MIESFQKYVSAHKKRVVFFVVVVSLIQFYYSFNDFGKLYYIIGENYIFNSSSISKSIGYVREVSHYGDYYKEVSDSLYVKAYFKVRTSEKSNSTIWLEMRRADLIQEWEVFNYGIE